MARKAAIPAGMALALGVGLAFWVRYKLGAPMPMTLTRDVFLPDRTLGILKVGTKTFYTLEDRARGLTTSMPLSEIIAITQLHLGTTAIAATEGNAPYNVGIREDSPSQGRPVLHVLDVPGNRWIYLHAGNAPLDSLGCILVGSSRNVQTGTIAGSRDAVSWLEKDPAGPLQYIRNGGAVTLAITGKGA